MQRMGTPTCAHIVLLLAPSILCCGGRRKEKQNVDFTGQDSVMRFQATCSKVGTGGRIGGEPDGAGQRLPAWGDAPAKALIEAVKRQFDPKQQLNRGRLPGVQGGVQTTA